MKIISDCDGCVLDFYTPFEKWCRKNYPDEPTDAIIKKKDGVFNPEHMRVRVELMDAYHASGEIASLPYFPGAVHALVTLKNQGHEVRLVTALPKKFEKFRFRNLNPFFNPEDIHCVGEEKIDTIKAMAPDFMIEDKPSMIKKFTEAGIKTLYPVRHYNKDSKYGIPFEDWKEAQAIIEAHVE